MVRPKQAAPPPARNMNALRTTLSTLFALALAVGGWFAAPSIIARLTRTVPTLDLRALPPLAVQGVVAFLVFLLGLALSTMLLGLLMPAPKGLPNERQLAREQQDLWDEQKAARRAAIDRENARRRDRR